MSILSLNLPISHQANAKAVSSDVPYGPRQAKVLDQESFERARAEIATWPGYSVTPLRNLSGMASAAGVGCIWYKDEASRFGLDSFKALGGAYAVLCLLKDELRKEGLADDARSGDIIAGKYADTISKITVTCATDGNHGRSVAWGAQSFGCKCVIYIHATVSEGRAKAISRYGADIVRVAGNYDDAVRKAAEDAAAMGRFVVSDTSYPGYMDVPRSVMQGYTIMVQEALDQLNGDVPTHVFIQGGVGGLAAAVVGHLWDVLGAARPRMVVVEPDQAACLFESAAAGKPVEIKGELDTLMAGLACGEVSLLAWEILEEGVGDFLTVTDTAATDCMILCADGVGDDTPFVAGESAVAGMAGLLLAARDASLAARLDLGPESRILLFGSEGASDVEVYTKIVGRTPDQVENVA